MFLSKIKMLKFKDVKNKKVIKCDVCKWAVRRKNMSDKEFYKTVKTLFFRYGNKIVCIACED